jgi:hypothetical protein
MSERAKEAFRAWAEYRHEESATREFARLAAVLRILQSSEGNLLRAFEEHFAVTLNRYLDLVGLGLSMQKITPDAAIYDLEYFIASPRSGRGRGTLPQLIRQIM